MIIIRRNAGRIIRYTVSALLGGLVLLCILMLTLPVFAKNTYEITDGSHVFTYSTHTEDPAQVLQEAGLQLEGHDSFVIGEDGSIIVCRGQEPNQTLVREEAYTITVPHETLYLNDTSLPQGCQQVLTEGIDGETLCTATVTYRNGQELERQVTEEALISAPVTELVAIGTADPAPADPDGMPIFTENTITLPTGEVLTYTRTMQVGATAYFCNPWDRGITATGTKARVGAIAVDPTVIPYGTRMFIVSNDGEYVYGIATAEDCGDTQYICGNRVDLYYDTYEECIQFGYRECTVYFLGT